MRHCLKQPIFRVHLFQFVFTPKLIPTLAFIVILPILINLGFWQLDRAQQKTRIAQQFKRGAQTIITQEELDLKPKSLSYKKIRLHGRYDSQHTFLLDNRVINHRVGYDVISPFKLINGQVILVNRGFVARAQDRKILPKLAYITGLQTIEGRIKLPPKKIFLLGKTPNNPKWPKVIQALDLKKLSQSLKKPLIPVIILLGPNNPHGFIRQWKSMPIKAEKHHGYAIQWFSLALTLVIIYVLVNTRRGRNDQTRK